MDVTDARILNFPLGKFSQPLITDTGQFRQLPVIAMLSYFGPEAIDVRHDIHSNNLVKNYSACKQDFTLSIVYPDGMNNDAETLAKNLKILMEYHGHSQTDLARKSGVSQKTISNMCNPDAGSNNLDSISAIAKVYGLQTWHLLVPNANLDVLINSSIEKMVDNWIYIDKNARNYLLSVAEKETLYSKLQKTG